MTHAEAIATRPSSRFTYWVEFVLGSFLGLTYLIDISVSLFKHRFGWSMLIDLPICLIACAAAAQGGLRFFFPVRAAHLAVSFTEPIRNRLRWIGITCQFLGFILIIVGLTVLHQLHDLAFLGWALYFAFFILADLRGERPYTLPRRRSEPLSINIPPIRSEH